MRRTSKILVAFFVAIIATATMCSLVDAQHRQRKAVQDSIMAPTKCILDSVSFQTREAAEAFAKTIVGAEVLTSTTSTTKVVGGGTSRRHCSPIVTTTTTREQVNLVKYQGRYYEVYEDVWKWIFKKIQ